MERDTCCMRTIIKRVSRNTTLVKIQSDLLFFPVNHFESHLSM